MKTNLEDDPGRWSRYDKMMSARDLVDFSRPDFCAKCGKRNGDHVTEAVLRRNPYACRFVRK